MGTWLNVLLVLVLILIEGAFVAAEIALISLREGQVRALEERGGRRGKAVARLAADPNRWLAAVQIGITLTALLSAAVGAVTLSSDAKDRLVAWGMSAGWAGPIALVGVTVGITFVTLVIGELAPKRLALQRSESVARGLAPALDLVARFSRPVIWVLSWTTNLVVRLLGGDPTAGRESITEEELRGLVAAHESLDADERRLIDDVFAAGERQVREVMVPRTEAEFLDASMTVTRAINAVTKQTHSRYPVVRGSADEVVGFVHVRDLLTKRAQRGAKLADIVREVKMLPATKHVLPALSEMRREGHHLAVVVDEYGGTAGIVTLEDLIEEVIGDIRDEYDDGTAPTRRLRGGDVSADGLLNLEEFAELTGIVLPDGPYETVAGFLINRLGHVPKLGESVRCDGALLKVTEMDGRRVARVRVTRRSVDEGEESA